METKTIKKAARILLGANLLFAGISHLSFARKAFRAQVPNWVPLKKDNTVVYSGFAEIALGSALIFIPAKYEAMVSRVAAGFFTVVFPGNIASTSISITVTPSDWIPTANDSAACLFSPY